MKKHANFNRLSQIICFSFLILLFSCDKPEKYNQKFDDVFDVSGVEALNEKISDPGSISVLNEEFANVNLDIAGALENISLDEMLAHFNKSMELSPVEIDMLLKNNSKTYIDVINRFGSLPAQMESLAADDFKPLRQSSLNKYLLKVKAEPVYFYSTDYYTAILELQKYMKDEVIEPMNLLKKAVISPGKNLPPPTPATILKYKIITLNNVWDMWWTYWSDGTRTKHKGGAGSFPG